MKIYPECFICAFRMSVEALSMNCDTDADIFYDVVRSILFEMQHFKNTDTPPALITQLQRVVMSKTDVHDLYRELKQRDIHVANALASMLNMQYKNEGMLDIKTSLLIAAIGNTLDSGISLNDELSDKFDFELEKGFALYDGKIFFEKLNTARTILILGDNIGEAILDQYLVRKLKPRQVYYAVRGHAILNDIAMEDIEKISANGVEFVSTGSDICGIVLPACEKQFLEIFNCADIVISKGMGNYETLSSYCNRDVFYLLKAKCKTMAKHINVAYGDYIFKYESKFAG